MGRPLAAISASCGPFHPRPLHFWPGGVAMLVLSARLRAARACWPTAVLRPRKFAAIAPRTDLAKGQDVLWLTGGAQCLSLPSPKIQQSTCSQRHAVRKAFLQLLSALALTCCGWCVGRSPMRTRALLSLLSPLAASQVSGLARGCSGWCQGLFQRCLPPSPVAPSGVVALALSSTSCIVPSPAMSTMCAKPVSLRVGAPLELHETWL